MEVLTVYVMIVVQPLLGRISSIGLISLSLAIGAIPAMFGEGGPVSSAFGKMDLSAFTLLGLAGCRTRSSAKLVLSVFAPWVLNALYILADARSAHTVPLAIACLATLVNSLVSVVFRSLHMPQIGLSRGAQC